MVSMNLGADDDDDDDVMQVGRKKGGAAMSRAVASHISSNDERVMEPRCVRLLPPPKKYIYDIIFPFSHCSQSAPCCKHLKPIVVDTQ